MQIELQTHGVRVELEPTIQAQFKGIIVGDYAADLLVTDKIVVELKPNAVYQSAHEAQLLNEMRGSGIHPGYLINFGGERVEYQRLVF
jgi:GxxExxY protein